MKSPGPWHTAAVTVTGLAEPEQVPSVNVTADVLPALGIAPSIGRWFSQNDDSPGAPKTAISDVRLLEGALRRRPRASSAAA